VDIYVARQLNISGGVSGLSLLARSFETLSESAGPGAISRGHFAANYIQKLRGFVQLLRSFELDQRAIKMSAKRCIYREEFIIGDCNVLFHVGMHTLDKRRALTPIHLKQ
jgi:hypothetical protein